MGGDRLQLAFLMLIQILLCHCEDLLQESVATTHATSLCCMQDSHTAATVGMMGLNQKPSLAPSTSLEGARPSAVLRRSNSDASSPARMLQQEIIRLQIEQDDMAMRLKVSSLPHCSL